MRKRYEPQLRKGIKIAIDLVNAVQQDKKDGDVDVKVRIAPNDTTETVVLSHNEMDFSKLNITLPNSSGKEISVRKEDRKNVHVGNMLLDTFIDKKLKEDGNDAEKEKLKTKLNQIENAIEIITREDATGTIKKRENQIIKELTSISKLLLQLMGLTLTDITPPEASYVENGRQNSITLLHRKNKRKGGGNPSGTSPEWKFLSENKKTGRGNRDFMRMHLNYAKLGGSNKCKNWVVAPGWINKSPVITAVETAAYNFIEAAPSNVIWYEAKVNEFYKPENDWTWKGDSLTKFPKSVSVAFGKYSVKKDGKTWTKDSRKIGRSGAVQVPKLSLKEHHIPSIMVPSKTDWFYKNTEKGEKGLKTLKITEVEVNMMQSDGVRGVYSNFETLESKLLKKYGDESEDKIDRLIEALEEALNQGLLRW